MEEVRLPTRELAKILGWVIQVCSMHPILDSILMRRKFIRNIKSLIICPKLIRTFQSEC